MKILHIDTGKEWRGGQRQVFILHKNLIEKGIESHLLCFEEGKLFKNTEKELLNVLPLKRKFLSDILLIKRTINKINPDIIHFHDSKSLNYINFLPMKIKKVETRRVSYPISKFSQIFKYKKCDFHVGVSEDISKYLRIMFDNVMTIHSCIELERFSKHCIKSPFKKNFEKNILFVGSFSTQKGIEILINAMEIILQKNKEIGLHIVGDGELSDRLKKQVDLLEINDNVIFYGFQSNVEDFYLSSDICVVPSVDGEGSSGVIKEAMASRNIVIASDLEANKELIFNNKNGILFKNADVLDLANKLYMIIENKIDLDPSQINKSVKSFSCIKNVEKYIELYSRLS